MNEREEQHNDMWHEIRKGDKMDQALQQKAAQNPRRFPP